MADYRVHIARVERPSDYPFTILHLQEVGGLDRPICDRQLIDFSSSVVSHCESIFLVFVPFYHNYII